ncbi:MAG: DUF6585 family protein [Brevefilum sp.]
MGTSQSALGNIKSSQISDLGTEIATYPSWNQNHKRVIGLAFGCSIILASFFFIILRLSFMATAVRLHGRAAVLLHAPSLMLLIAFLPIGIVILLATIWNWNNHLALYEGGFIIHTGLRKKIWRWDWTTRLDTRIMHIKFGGNIIEVLIRLIVGNPKRTLVIRNQYKSMSDLLQRIRTKTLPLLAEWAQEQLKQNIHLEFHKEIVAVKAGLEVKGQLVEWQEIAHPRYTNKKIILNRIQDQDKIIEVNLNKITNLIY